MPRVFQSSHYEIDHDIIGKMVIVTRSETSFKNAKEHDAALEQVVEAVAPFRDRGLRFLVDHRAGKTFGPESESGVVLATRLPQLLRGFQRCAIVMKSPVGVLQARRLMEKVPIETNVSLDLDEARAFLIG
jgi:hypothetical protein